MAAERVVFANPTISDKSPTAAELRRTDELVQFMQTHSQYELASEERRRMLVLQKLNRLVKQWVRAVLESKGRSLATVASAGGKIFAFGSSAAGDVALLRSRWLHSDAVLVLRCLYARLVACLLKLDLVAVRRIVQIGRLHAKLGH